MKKLNQCLSFVVSLIFICGIAVATPVKSVQENEDMQMQRSILHYVNIYRAKHHLGQLRLNEAASLEATRHSRDMANQSVPFGHTQFNTRIQHLYKKFEHCRGGAENVAYYRTDAKRLVDAWIASPGHRRNLAGHYNVTGIGIAHGKAGWAYYTQIFVQTDNPNV